MPNTRLRASTSTAGRAVIGPLAVEVAGRGEPYVEPQCGARDLRVGESLHQIRELGHQIAGPLREQVGVEGGRGAQLQMYDCAFRPSSDLDQGATLAYFGAGRAGAAERIAFQLRHELRADGERHWRDDSHGAPVDRGQRGGGAPADEPYGHLTGVAGTGDPFDEIAGAVANHGLQLRERIQLGGGQLAGPGTYGRARVKVEDLGQSHRVEMEHAALGALGGATADLGQAEPVDQRSPGPGSSEQGLLAGQQQIGKVDDPVQAQRRRVEAALSQSPGEQQQPAGRADQMPFVVTGRQIVP
ncbi:hypothetical protein ACFWIB_33985 [Streptomyces sp. NPDC127051]|uniref:hypothetical protein n=1 Tax=Streptomyces sp. NPDC127051 TaxID=3347119 RepID=UPI0036655D2F